MQHWLEGAPQNVEKMNGHQKKLYPTVDWPLGILNELISGDREPIYNLNEIIRLQAVFGIITNESATALDFLSNQSAQRRTTIFQHWMVLDYLLAEEGFVEIKLFGLLCVPLCLLHNKEKGCL